MIKLFEEARIMNRRKQRNRQEWKRIIGEHRRSGLTAVAFCRRKKVGLASFYRWRQRLSDGGEPKVESRTEPFIDMGRLEQKGVSAAEMSAGAAGDLVVTLDLGDGARLTIRRG
jgi:putative transposase